MELEEALWQATSVTLIGSPPISLAVFHGVSSGLFCLFEISSALGSSSSFAGKNDASALLGHNRFFREQQLHARRAVGVLRIQAQDRTVLQQLRLQYLKVRKELEAEDLQSTIACLPAMSTLIWTLPHTRT
ncbi:hypothetical protein EJB05_26143, partial [Eragrostis curvula]